MKPQLLIRELNSESLIAYYTELARAIYPIKIIIYNMPMYSGVNIDYEAVKVLAKLPNIVGIKDSAGTKAQIQDLHEACPDLDIYCGSASNYLNARQAGAIGGIMAFNNVGVDLMRGIDQLARTDLPKAEKLQADVAKVNKVITADYGVPGLKYMMAKDGYHSITVRYPLMPLTPEQKSKVSEAKNWLEIYRRNAKEVLREL